MALNKKILILFFIICRIGFSADNPVYDKTVDAVGLITDKSGAVASGFFINPKTFVTNYHVSSDLDIKSAKIEMRDDRVYKVKKIIKQVKVCDLAVIEISDECQNYLELAEDVIVRKNNIVYSLGNPTDEDMHVDYFHMSKGRVKKVGNDSWYYDNESEYTHIAYVIQHTAIIKPGNSGGPLLNKDGKVIGINTFFYGDSSNYAIHVSELISILNKQDISFNKSFYNEKQYTLKERKRRSITERFETVFEDQQEFIEDYSAAAAVLVAMYYGLVFMGTILITAYVVTAKPSPRKIKYY